MKEIQKGDEDDEKFSFIGDVHTHPLRPYELGSEFDSHQNALPSEGDIASIVAEYEKGVLQPDEPFIFGIATIDDKGGSQYCFYRIIKNDNGWGWKDLD